MVHIQYQSRTIESTDSGRVTTLVYYGTRDEMEKVQDNNPVGVDDVTSVKVSQSEGDLWTCEIRRTQTSSGDTIERPSAEWGKKSATLDGSMLSVQIEKSKNYLANWNHYLFCDPSAFSEVPDWWATAKNIILTAAQKKKYGWGKMPSDAPIIEGVVWLVLKEPTKLGEDTTEFATYTVTERARFRSPRAAGNMIAGKLNRIGTPCETFGISDPDWKCDHAQVQYNGKYWIATLTWTKSVTSAGWDKDRYELTTK